ncbi:S1 family peptidase [Nannocystaceae bacterium ST9]
MRRVSIGSALMVLSLASLPAFAGEPEIAAPPQHPYIQGGTNAQACQWPTSITIFNGNGLCSGTLIHPQVVVTAAHCIVPSIGGPPDEVRFGERTFMPAFSVSVDHCQYNPGYTNGVGPSDFAYCLLDESVDLPPTPPLMGCEVEALVKDAPVTIVGFGKLTDADQNSAGTKRWGSTVISSDSASETVLAGTAQVAPCEGDSGGTGYIQLDDGGWRAWGILSGGPDGCGDYGIYVTMHSMVGWVEEETGLDVTPCHDADGTWNPGPACTGFAASPGDTGNWNQLCPDTLGSLPETCGPSLDDPMEAVAPSVAIVEPPEGMQYPDVPSTFDITVEADDGQGYAVVHVDLFVDGMLVASRDRDAWAAQEPWVFSGAEFFSGEWTLSAQATDYWGNVGESEPVVIVVGELPSDTTESGGEDTTESGGETTSDTGETTTDSGDDEVGSTDEGPALDEGGDAGCSCESSGSGSGGGLAVVLALPLLFGLRRRHSQIAGSSQLQRSSPGS